MTTAPRTLMMIGRAPGGKAGVTQPAAAERQSVGTSHNSKMKERPMRETKPMMNRSSFL
jgi:hypothetical protein